MNPLASKSVEEEGNIYIYIEREREIEKLNLSLVFDSCLYPLVIISLSLATCPPPPKACAVAYLVQGEGALFRRGGVVVINAVMGCINGDVQWQ